MRRIDISEESASEFIAQIAAHLPPHVALGQISVVAPKWVFSSTDAGSALWDLTGGGAQRLLCLSGGRSEVTTFRDGVEVERRLIAA